MCDYAKCSTPDSPIAISEPYVLIQQPVKDMTVDGVALAVEIKHLWRYNLLGEASVTICENCMQIEAQKEKERMKKSRRILKPILIVLLIVALVTTALHLFGKYDLWPIMLIPCVATLIVGFIFFLNIDSGESEYAGVHLLGPSAKDVMRKHFPDCFIQKDGGGGRKYWDTKGEGWEKIQIMKKSVWKTSEHC